MFFFLAVSRHEQFFVATIRGGISIAQCQIGRAITRAHSTAEIFSCRVGYDASEANDTQAPAK